MGNVTSDDGNFAEMMFTFLEIDQFYLFFLVTFVLGYVIFRKIEARLKRTVDEVLLCDKVLMDKDKVEDIVEEKMERNNRRLLSDVGAMLDEKMKTIDDKFRKVFVELGDVKTELGGVKRSVDSAKKERKIMSENLSKIRQNQKKMSTSLQSLKRVTNRLGDHEEIIIQKFKTGLTLRFTTANRRKRFSGFILNLRRRVNCSGEVYLRKGYYLCMNLHGLRSGDDHDTLCTVDTFLNGTWVDYYGKEVKLKANEVFFSSKAVGYDRDRNRAFLGTRDIDDCVFINIDKPEGTSLKAFPYSGDRLMLETVYLRKRVEEGSKVTDNILKTTIIEKRSNFGNGDSSYHFTSNKILYFGDSGSLVLSKTGRAVGIYCGEIINKRPPDQMFLLRLGEVVKTFDSRQPIQEFLCEN